MKNQVLQFGPDSPTLSAGTDHSDSASNESVNLPWLVSAPRFSAGPMIEPVLKAKWVSLGVMVA